MSDNDNLIPFPSKESGDEKKELNIEEARERLKEVEINRRKDIATLYSSMPEQERNRIIATSLDAINDYLDMIRQDLINLVQGLEQQAIGAYSAQLHTETAIAVLLQKEVVSEEEMKEAFDKIHKDAQNRLKKHEE